METEYNNFKPKEKSKKSLETAKKDALIRKLNDFSRLLKYINYKNDNENENLSSFITIKKLESYKKSHPANRIVTSFINKRIEPIEKLINPKIINFV